MRVVEYAKVAYEIYSAHLPTVNKRWEDLSDHEQRAWRMAAASIVLHTTNDFAKVFTKHSDEQ